MTLEGLMTYTPEQISQIVLKVLKEIEQPDISKLSDDEKIKLVRDPNTSKETLNVLATDKSADVRYWVSCNPNISQESLAILATDKDPGVRHWVALNSNTSQESLAILATDKDSDVRYGVAKHPNTSIETLNVLATDENYWVRCCVARNPNYKKQVLELNTKQYGVEMIMKQTITAAELFVIADVLNKSLSISNYEGFTAETRERVRDKVLRIMSDMEAEIVCGDVEPIVVSGDVGG